MARSSLPPEPEPSSVLTTLMPLPLAVRPAKFIIKVITVTSKIVNDQALRPALRC